MDGQPAQGAALSKNKPFFLAVRVDIEDRDFHCETKLDDKAYRLFEEHARELSGEIGFAFEPSPDTRLVVEAETEHGERLARCWRDEGVLGASALADRVRWQLEGWLHGPPAVRPTAGLVRLVLLHV